MAIEEELLEIERTLWTGGPEAYKANLEPKCLVAFKDMPGEMSKEDIAKTAEPGRWKDVSMQRKGIAKLGASSVVITYECTAKRKDDQPYHALVSSGYVKRRGGWKLAFHAQAALDS